MPQPRYHYDVLNINSFIVDIVKAPTIRYHVQEATLPDISLGSVTQANPFLDIANAGDKLTYGDFSMTFMVDEMLFNYGALHTWIKGLGFPTCWTDYQKLINGDHGNQELLTLSRGTRNEVSDIVVTILTNHKNPKASFILHDAFPTSLSGLQMNVTDQDTTPVTCTATFKFTGMTFKPSAA